MNRKEWTGTDLESLMDMLASEEGWIRQKARKSLVALGKHAVPPLAHALRNSKSHQLRWEAAKAFGAIGDTRSIPSLVKALADSDPDVAWLAAVALNKFKRAAWSPLLRALMKAGPDSVSLRHGAHHVLLNQRENGFNDLLATLMKALEPGAVPGAVTVAAYETLQRMKTRS